MSIYVRCPNCHQFNTLKRIECSICGEPLKGVKNYYARVSINGKRNFQYAGNTLSVARDFESSLKYEVRTGTVIQNKPMFFEEYVDKFFIPHYQSKNKSVHTELQKFNQIENYFKNKYLHEIKPSDIDSYYQYKLKSCKPSTAKNHLAIVKRMFNYAVEMDFIKASPVRTKPMTFDNERTRYLNEKEKFRLLSACKDSKSKMLYYIVIVALNTGMRLGAIKKLKPKDISNGCITVPAENSKNKKPYIIPLNSTLIDLFNELKEFDFDIDIKSAFIRAVVKAKIEDFHFHDLRHTFASDLVMKGVDLYSISKLLGHSSIKMTQKYAHLRPTALKNAVDKLTY